MMPAFAISDDTSNDEDGAAAVVAAAGAPFYMRGHAALILWCVGALPPPPGMSAAWIPTRSGRFDAVPIDRCLESPCDRPPGWPPQPPKLPTPVACGPADAVVLNFARSCPASGALTAANLLGSGPQAGAPVGTVRYPAVGWYGDTSLDVLVTIDSSYAST
eukprot:6822367-Prymnesium_polylepis.1